MEVLHAMAGDARTPLSSYLRRRIAGVGQETSADHKLLERFVNDRDEDAFSSILERHGPLVWSVCRSILSARHDAEDAFQATFLVLARKAAAIRRRQSLRCWLHGVAFRIALRLKMRRERQQLLPDPGSVVDTGDTFDADAAERAALLHEEIERLPEKYRKAILLYHLEDHGRDEAARLLGVSAGTLKGRLERGRKLLRERLLRRGLAGSLIPAMTTHAVGQGQVPLPLIDATLQVCLRSPLPGPALVAARITELAQGAVNAMLLARIKFYGVSVGLIGVLGIGIGLSMLPGVAAQAPNQKTAQPIVEDRLSDMLRKREDVVSREFEMRWKQFLAGQGTLDLVINASERWREAQLELCGSKEERLKRLEAHVERMTETAKILEARVEAGRVTAKDGLFAEYARLDAEIRLERERSR